MQSIVKVRGREQAAAAVASAVILGSAAILTRSIATKARLARFKGQVVCITGSSRGLGLALAFAFGRLGARLVLCARDEAELDRARAMLVARGATDANLLTVAVDVRDPASVAVMIEKANAAFGQIDVLINNAGVIAVGPIQNHTVATFRDSMNTNFFGGVHCTLAVLPQMLERGAGSIVNIASIAGKVPVPHLLPYTASKFAVVGFSQGLSAELRSQGVHVLTVCPGLMRTGSHLQAQFTGEAGKEYRLFSFLANLPGMSAGAQGAANKIVRALADRRAEVTITPQAAVAARLAPTFPAVTRLLSSFAPRVLPKPAVSDVYKGSQLRSEEIWPATQIGQNAASKFNQFS